MGLKIFRPWKNKTHQKDDNTKPITNNSVFSLAAKPVTSNTCLIPFAKPMKSSARLLPFAKPITSSRCLLLFAKPIKSSACLLPFAKPITSSNYSLPFAEPITSSAYFAYVGNLKKEHVNVCLRSKRQSQAVRVQPKPIGLLFYLRCSVIIPRSYFKQLSVKSKHNIELNEKWV